MCPHCPAAVLALRRLLFLRLPLSLGGLCSKRRWLLVRTLAGLLKQELLLPAILGITNAHGLTVAWSLARVVRVHLVAIQLLLGRRYLDDDAAAVQPKCILVVGGF